MTSDDATSKPKWRASTAGPVAKQAVFVLGMHRSGTSALAGVLEQLGLPFGPVTRDPSPHNLKGHFENFAVDAINMAIIGPWNDPTMWTPNESDHEIIHAIYHAYRDDLFGLKDPAMLLTLPLWAHHIARARLVGTVRHPASVVRSFRARTDAEGRPPNDEAALASWGLHNRRLLAVRQTVEFAIVDFDAPRDEYLEQLQTAVASVGIEYDPARASGWIEPGMVHQRSSDPVPSEYRELYEALLAYTKEPVARAGYDGPGLAARLAPVYGDWGRTAPPDRFYLDAFHEAHSHIARAELHGQNLERMLADRDAEVSRLNAEIAALREEVGRRVRVPWRR